MYKNWGDISKEFWASLKLGNNISKDHVPSEDIDFSEIAASVMKGDYHNDLDINVRLQDTIIVVDKDSITDDKLTCFMSEFQDEDFPKGKIVKLAYIGPSWTEEYYEVALGTVNTKGENIISGLITIDKDFDNNQLRII